MAEQIGTVTAVLPVQSGVSQRTGSEWKSQEFVIEIPNGQYNPKHACFKLFGDAKISNAASLLVAGKQVKVSFDIDAREYNGRWFNSLDAWKVEDATNDAAGFPTGGAAVGQATTAAVAAPTTAVMSPRAAEIPAPQPNPNGDPLPF